MIAHVAIAAVAGFALGSVPWGVIVLRLAGGPDPRTLGSRNIGATNVVRAGGKGLGALTLLLDAGKGAVACLLFGGVTEAAAVAGFFAVAGHCFTPWLGFRGGKGVATLLGAGAVLGWPHVPVAFGVTWAAFFLISRIPAVASLQACMVAGMMMALLAARPGEAGTGAPRAAAAALLASCLVVTWRHRSNFERMRRADAAPEGAGGGA